VFESQTPIPILYAKLDPLGTNFCSTLSFKTKVRRLKLRTKFANEVMLFKFIAPNRVMALEKSHI
jgi:hypothetical protein